MNLWYVTTTGAGGHTGIDEANAWDLAEAIAAYEDSTVVNGDTIGLKNNAIYTTEGIVLTRQGNAFGFVRITGYQDTIGDGGKATIQRSGGAGILFDSNLGYYNIIENLIFDGQNSGTHNFVQGRNSIVRNCESYAAGGAGFITTSFGGGVTNCVAHNNGNYGFHGGGGIINCLSYLNTLDGFAIVTYAQCFNCISCNNGQYGFLGYRATLSNCISYHNGLGECSFAFAVTTLNLVVAPLENRYALVRNFGPVNYHINTNFDSVSPGYKSAAIQHSINEYEVDSQFNNPSAYDFTRTGNNLDAIGFSEVGLISGVNYRLPIGVFTQKEASSGEHSYGNV